MSYIIVKYADQLADENVHPSYSVVGSYSAQQCGVTQVKYETAAEAASDLTKLQKFNPTVGYGLVNCLEIENEVEK